MNYQTLLVTPEQAQQWLKMGGKNRKVSDFHVERLAREMISGHWILNGQTISFSAEGKLLDGQHRLNAVVKSGMTVPMSISFGVTDERAFESYDVVQKPRGAQDILALENIKNTTKVSAISRRLIHWERTQDKSAFTLTNISGRNLVPQEIVDYARRHVGEISSMLSAVKSSLPYRISSAGSSLVTALVLCNRIDEVTTLVFVEGLNSGASLNNVSPIYLLRERLIGSTIKKGYQWETEVMALTIKAWNKYNKGESLRFLRWRQEGDSPEKFPIPGGK